MNTFEKLGRIDHLLSGVENPDEPTAVRIVEIRAELRSLVSLCFKQDAIIEGKIKELAPEIDLIILRS